jgi:hypothetical protein
MMPTLAAPSRATVLAALATTAITLAPSLHAQQSRPPLRQLGAAVATSEALGAVSSVQHLPNGHLLVNDPVRRRVLLLDSALKTVGVVADTTAATKSAYGSRGGGLLPFRGDSTLFVDPASLSMLVIDPAGKVIRVMAAPRANDVIFLMGGPQGNPGFDRKGRLVYRVMSFGGRAPGGAPGQPFVPPTFPDSAPIVRFDLMTRKLDTATFVKIAAPRMNVVQNESRVSVTPIINPLQEVDDWAILPDGTIAIVRRDYHVDFISSDGVKTSAPKVPFDWQRLTDSAKVAVIDSAKAQMERVRAAMIAGGPAAAATMMGAGGPGGGGAPMIVTRTIDGPPPRGGPGGAPDGPRPAGGQVMNMPQLTFVAPSELPDYRPAFTNGSVRADAEGKLWVRVLPAKPTGGGPEYDVLDRAGKLVDRVALPAGTTIAGFGSGGVVYLGVRDAAGVHVVRAREK